MSLMLNDPQFSRCSYCGEKSDRFNFVNCDGCDQTDLCPNCYDPQVSGGNLCSYCTGLYCPPARHPDNI